MSKGKDKVVVAIMVDGKYQNFNYLSLMKAVFLARIGIYFFTAIAIIIMGVFIWIFS